MRSKAQHSESRGNRAQGAGLGRAARLAVKSESPLPVARSESNLMVSPLTTKQARIIAMLHREEGTSIAMIAAAAGWQRHSVRGFFAAIVKKRFGFDLTYRKGEGGERLYRIDLLSARQPSDVRDR